MGNALSGKTYTRLYVNDLKQTGFDNYTEVSSIKRNARIERVTDESFGKASNLLKVEGVNKTSVSNDYEENTDGWLTKRHDLVVSVDITLCNNTKVYGLDIDTTGYIDSCPSYADVEGYRDSDATWQIILPEVSIKEDTHNFFQIYNSDVFSRVRLNVAPAGGVARFRTYGQIIPDWSDKDKEYNLASANFGASVVRWTDLRNANSPNILLDHGTKMSDGWLSPRSRLGKDRNDFILIQLATPGKLSSIVIDTTGFDCNSPTAVFIQGCYSKDTDPQYDLYNSWIGMVSQSPILPGGLTRFDVSDVTDEIISHIRLYVMPDGGIQQVKVYGVPADKDRKKGRLLLEQAPQPKAINNTPHQLNQAIVDAMEEVLDDKPIIEHFNLLQTTRSSPTSSPAITEYASSSNSDSATIVTSSQEVKIEEIVIDTVDVLNVCSSSRDASPSSSLRKRKAASVEPSNDSPEEAPSTQSITKKLRGRPKKTAA